jgi:hypothetical protein
MNELKKYLTINAIFSAISGLSMLLFSSRLNSLFAIENAFVFPLIGANLIVFSSFCMVCFSKISLGFGSSWTLKIWLQLSGDGSRNPARQKAGTLAVMPSFIFEYPFFVSNSLYCKIADFIYNSWM